jgi:hypothetical protein
MTTTQSETTEHKDGFFFVADTRGGYSGALKLPDGTRYAGTIFANDGPNGPWYRLPGVTAADVVVKNADDAFVRSGPMPSSLDGQTVKPMELRLNYYADKKLIGTLVTSKGAFTVFAEETTWKGKASLRGNVKPYEPRPKPEKIEAIEPGAATAKSPKRRPRKKVTPKGEPPVATADVVAVIDPGYVKTCTDHAGIVPLSRWGHGWQALLKAWTGGRRQCCRNAWKTGSTRTMPSAQSTYSSMRLI